MHSIMNMGKPFLIPVNNYIDKDKVDEWKEIVKQTNTFHILIPILDIKINFNPNVVNN